ncbi:hypothetical protein CTI12_AA496490 [Artemisia annua]|uniref:Uncharacterized protein n=1 Tax=Artemisia annua TaxID=35608 RepID=A0A2U1LFG1_ARTAN|nr:hypothetical protein CTI12_AA496490 [Artemisia annua]
MGKDLKVSFNVHKHGEFAFDPLSYVGGCVSVILCFSSDRGVFTRAFNHVINDIPGAKWALFYCKPNMSLAHGLTLIRTDNDIHKFFDQSFSNGSIDLYIAHKFQPLSKYYIKNMIWQKEDAGQRCCLTNPFKRGQKTKRVLNIETDGRLNANDTGCSGTGEDTMFHQVGVETEHPNGPDKGKYKICEEGLLEINSIKGGKKLKQTLNGSESHTDSNFKVVKTYRKAVINGRAKMVEVQSE